MVKLHIITSTARPHLISSMVSSVISAEPHNIYLEWHLCFQSPQPDNHGMDRINKLLDIIDDGWVCFIPDDGMFHKRIFKRLEESINNYPEVQAIIVDQERRDGVGNLRACPENIRPCRIDGMQYFLKRSLIGDTRLLTEPRRLKANDGYFIQDIYRKNPDYFLFINETLSEFNSTFWVREKKFTEQSNHEAGMVPDVELCNK